MAITVAVLDTAPHSVLYEITEDGTAAATVQQDVPGDLAAGPLADLIGSAVTFADQAAAQAAIEEQVDMTVHLVSATPVGATGAPTLALDPNISGAAAGNFRLDLISVKAANGDVAVYQLRMSYRHSIND